MFYRPANGHGLPHDPFSAIVSPRPIGWISTRGRLGDNLSPYSFFNAAAYVPPQVVFSSLGAKADRDGTKDSLAQIRETGVFCVNLVEPALVEQMNTSCADYSAGTDEFEISGLEKAQCSEIDCPRVAQAPAALECRLVKEIPLLGPHDVLVHAEVVGVHLREDCLHEGLYRPPGWVSRLGYRGDYATVTDTWELLRPRLK